MSKSTNHIRIALLTSVFFTFIAAPLTAPVAAEERVIIKPIERPTPDASDLQSQIDAVIGEGVESLVRFGGIIDSRQRAIADCHAVYSRSKDTSHAAEARLQECAVKPTAEMKATWDQIATTFHGMSKGFAAISDETGKIDTYIAEQDREDREELRLQEEKLSLAYGTLARAQDLRRSGKTFTRAEERQLLLLIDDVRTARQRVERINNRRSAHQGKAHAHAANRAWLIEMASESQGLEHKARNRGETWAATLDDVQRRGRINRSDVMLTNLQQRLGNSAETFRSFSAVFNKEPPQMPDAVQPSTAVTVQPRMITSNIDAELDAVLKDAPQNRAVTQ